MLEPLTMTVTVNGVPTFTSTIEGAHIAKALAKHPSMDDWVAAKGWSLNEVRDWLMDALKSYDTTATQALSPTLLWAACRGENGPEVEESVRHGGVTLMCAFQEDGGRRILKSALWLPDVQ